MGMHAKMGLIPLERIERSILLIRGEKVMLDRDLAAIYGVTTKALNQAVKRNGTRFPEDFMFRLTRDEVAELNRSQIVTGSQKHRDPRFPPFAFTEHGALMLANILNSRRAVQTSVHVVRAFLRLRQMLASNADLTRKVEALEKKYDGQFKVVFDAVRRLMSPAEPKRREIGFHVKPEDSAKAKSWKAPNL
jgi:hypothetical protein